MSQIKIIQGANDETNMSQIKSQQTNQIIEVVKAVEETELTQRSLLKECQLQNALAKYYEDTHLQNEYLGILNANIQVALQRTHQLSCREKYLK